MTFSNHHVANGISESIGKTPNVRLREVGKHEGNRTIYAKCEFMNPSGSIKDRSAQTRINDAFARSLLKHESTVIVPSTGNFAISVAFQLGSKCRKIIAILPDQIPQDKVRLLRCMDVEIVRCQWVSPDSMNNLAQKLSRDINGSIVLEEDTVEVDERYVSLAEEILGSFDDDLLDFVVVPLDHYSTCLIRSLHFSFLRKHSSVKIVVACSDTSFIAMEKENVLKMQYHQQSKIEGMYCPFKLPLLDSEKEFIHDFIIVKDEDAYDYARKLMKQEGLFAGSTSGACVYAATKISGVKHFNVAVILEDAAHLYPQTLLNMDWLIENKLIRYNNPSSSIVSGDAKGYLSAFVVADMDLPPVTTISTSCTIKSALDKMIEREYDQLPVLNDEKKLVGFVTLNNLEMLLRGCSSPNNENVDGNGVGMEDTVEKSMFKWKKTEKYEKITMNTPLNVLSEFFERHCVAFITDDDGRWILGICTRYDLIKFIQKTNPF